MATTMSGSLGRPGSSENGNATTPRSPSPLAAAVLEGVRRRDVRALGEFFDHYFDCIYGLAYRLLGDRSRAEDATRETLRRILRWACRVDPQGDSLPWVVTLTVRTCELFWKRSSAGTDREVMTSEAGGDRPADPADMDHPPKDQLLSGERHRQIQQAIAELSESLRTVVVLRDFQGFEQTEIATLTGSSRQAIRRRYATALTALAEKLRGIGE